MNQPVYIFIHENKVKIVTVNNATNISKRTITSSHHKPLNIKKATTCSDENACPFSHKCGAQREPKSTFDN